MEKPFKLPREFGEKWVAALRSGDYTQGTRYLFQTKERTPAKSYCCLGVASCLIGFKDVELEGLETLSDLNDHGFKNYNSFPHELSENHNVLGFLMCVNDGTTANYFKYKLTDFDMGQLVSKYKGKGVVENKNFDFCLNFEEIADLIEDLFEFY